MSGDASHTHNQALPFIKAPIYHTHTYTHTHTRTHTQTKYTGILVTGDAAVPRLSPRLVVSLPL